MQPDSRHDDDHRTHVDARTPRGRGEDPTCAGSRAVGPARGSPGRPPLRALRRCQWAGLGMPIGSGCAASASPGVACRPSRTPPGARCPTLGRRSARKRGPVCCRLGPAKSGPARSRKRCGGRCETRSGRTKVEPERWAHDETTRHRASTGAPADPYFALKSPYS